MANKAAQISISLNTVVLAIVSTMVGIGIHKADKAFDEITALRIEHNDLERRVGQIETAMGVIVVPPVKKP